MNLDRPQALSKEAQCALPLGSVGNLDQGQESESAGSYPRHRRYVLDKFSRLNARIYCSWHRFETFQQGRLPELSPGCLLPLPLDRNRTRAREEPQPTTGLWLFLLNAVNYQTLLERDRYECRNSRHFFRFGVRCSFLGCNPRAALRALKAQSTERLDNFFPLAAQIYCRLHRP